MPQAVHNEEPLYLGVDGGGTKCRALLVDEAGNSLGQGLSGPANPVHGLERACDSIADAARQCLQQAGLGESESRRIIAGVALAGVNVPSMYSAMNQWRHPFAQMHLCTDLHAACLGAHNGGDGAVIVIGTGSCGFVAVGDQRHTFGGHGFVLGDIGSGSWMGLKAVQAVLTAQDGLSAETRLTDVVAEILGARGVGVVEVMTGAKSSGFARLAPAVLKTAADGDAVALNIVKEGAGYIDQLARRLLAFQPPRLSMIGGLVEPLRPWLSEDVNAKVQAPLEQPEMGAIHFARDEQRQALTEASV